MAPSCTAAVASLCETFASSAVKRSFLFKV